ncbi:Hypothetical predicted protein, partial [Marmota monax]
ANVDRHPGKSAHSTYAIESSRSVVHGQDIPSSPASCSGTGEGAGVVSSFTNSCPAAL